MEYNNWRFSHYPSLADVLDEFPSCRLPATFVITQLPLIQPRLYSISSSLDIHPGEIHITVAVVKYANRYGKK